MNPDKVPTMNGGSPLNEAIAHFHGGRVRETHTICQALLQREPHNAAAWHLLGFARQALGQLADALDAFARAVTLRPDVAEYHFALANAQRIVGRLDDAIASYRRALDLKVDYPDASLNLGIALANSGRRDEAAEAWETVLQRNPRDADALANLANLYRGMGRLEQSIEYGHRALAIAPNNARTINNLAIALEHQGRLDEAITAYRQAMALQPRSPAAHSNLLLAMSYHPSIPPADILQEHRRWDAQHAAALTRSAPPSTVDRTPDKRLRVGYVSADFRQHPVAYFIEPILQAHDRDRFDVVCYSGVPHPDAVTERLQAMGHTWRRIVGRNDDDVAAEIRRDRVDILIDLAGHTAGRRLGVFARRAAPVQITYLGYPNTTGLSTMDWRITDAIADPPGASDAFYTERLYRLPRCAWCFRPPDELHATTRAAGPPGAVSGSITFGCFNKHAKISPAALDAWSTLLRAVPRARLVLKSPSLADASTRQRVLADLAQRGVAETRVDLIGATPTLAEHFASYNRVDIALDTFPYNGTTTTCDALWMGVPVITLAGHSHAARVGASLLSAAGLESLVASNVDDYVDRAAALASDVDRLTRLRAALPDQMERSPLGDAHGMARSIESAFTAMWHAWCNASP